MRTHTFSRVALVGIAGLAMVAAGCGKVARTGRSPVQLVVRSLQAASGAEPSKVGGTLFSDVVTLVKTTVNGQEQMVPTVYADNGQVVMSLILKDPGSSGVGAIPTDLNQVTINRYHVEYRRTDGRNAPGVDVPYGFDSGVTFTVPADGTVTANFELVRHDAKDEAPLGALRTSGVVIGTIAEVTFYGRDQAGNDISATGTIGVEFGNFGDPK